ncbi:hypothetical protein mRhiFer1_009268 [Rhinolophus ferrumequinum]|uniref:Uncharacterized protein n=1 Tax=Rhinolophus ferrumequinum TaxID=59479 RepID=A0A7J7S8H6_RHIFE|nr:hypothetical protein mRhiFer1_009268 [Rhinolophus ferrumequinum]
MQHQETLRKFVKARVHSLNQDTPPPAPASAQGGISAPEAAAPSQMGLSPRRRRLQCLSSGPQLSPRRGGLRRGPPPAPAPLMCLENTGTPAPCPGSGGGFMPGVASRGTWASPGALALRMGVTGESSLPLSPPRSRAPHFFPKDLTLFAAECGEVQA